MTDQDISSEGQSETQSSLLFGFRGRIGRRQFFIGLAAVVVLFVILFAAAASFMDPRGGSGAFIPIALLLLVAVPWIHAAIVTKRLRDAGKPSWLYFIFGIGPFVWLLATAELFEYLWPAILIVFVALILAPGFFPSQAPVPESSTS